MDDIPEQEGMGKISRRAFGASIAFAGAGIVTARILGERLRPTDTPIEDKINHLYLDQSRDWKHYIKSASEVVSRNPSDKNGDAWQVWFKTAISNENRTVFMGNRGGVTLGTVVPELSQQVYGSGQYPRKLNGGEVATGLDWILKQTVAKEKYNRIEVQKVSYSLDAEQIELNLGKADTDEKKRQIEQLRYLRGLFPDHKYPPGSVFRKITSFVVADHSLLTKNQQPPGTATVSKNLITRVSLLVPSSDDARQMEEYIAFETNHARFTTNENNSWRTIDGNTKIISSKVNTSGHLQLDEHAHNISQTISGVLDRAGK